MKLGYWCVGILMVFLSGCGILQQGYEDARKAGKNAVELKHYRYDFQVVSTQILNETNYSQENTFRMVVYQLSNDAAFRQASYYDLLTDAKAILANDLISQDVRIIYPFDKQEVRNDINNKTLFLGVVFFFNQPQADDKTWKVIIPIKDLNLFKDNYILVTGSQAKLVKKKQAKDVLKEQKQAEKARKKAIKERKKQEKLEKKAQAEQERLENMRQDGKK